jgi:hypothetical protein
MIRSFFALALLLSLSTSLCAQDDLFDLLEDETPQTQIVYATFKGTQLINAQTNETPGKGVLQYVIAHRFGSFTDDYLYNFLGLDNAQIRMQLDYGLTDKLNIGIGRSSVFKVTDGFVKYKMLQQREGAARFPFSLTWNSSVNYRGARYTDGIDHFFSDRLSFQHSAIFARKWNANISTLVAPGIVHWNLVPSAADPNTSFHTTFGGRIKLNKRVALTGEFSLMSVQSLSDGSTFTVPGGIGVDIETGGHVFQFHLSNTRAMSNPYWMSRNTFSALDGSLFLGFNISRVFTVR